MWRTGQTYTSISEAVVWKDPSLDFAELLKLGFVSVISRDNNLLVIEDTVQTVSGEHTYEITKCLWLETGEIVYNISNITSSSHGATYRNVHG